MDCFYRIYIRPDSPDKKFIRSSKAFAIAEIVFVQAPNNKKFKEHIKDVKGGCVKFIKLSTVKINVLSTFEAGDPIGFKGIAIREVNFTGKVEGRYLKIKVWQLPNTYVYVYINNADELKLKQKALK